MAIPGPGGLFGVTGPSTIAEDAIAATIIVGNSAQGDIPNITCHVVDDIAAGLALLPATGGLLHIKRGTYNPAAAISIPRDNTTIQGEWNVVINKPGAGVNLFEIPSGRTFVTIRNIRELNGQGDVNGGNLIDIDRGQDILIDNVGFINNPGNPPGVDAHGINIEGTAPSSTTRIKIIRCRFDTMGRAIYAESTDAAIRTVSYITIHQCDILQAEKEGIYLLFTEYCTISETVVSTTGQSGSFDGVFLSGRDAANRSRRHTLNSIVIDNATDDGLEVEFCDESGFVKIVAHTNGRDGINLNNSNNNVIDSCICTANGDDGVDLTGDRNNVVDNQLRGNAGTSLVNGGTNTITAHNQV